MNIMEEVDSSHYFFFYLLAEQLLTVSITGTWFNPLNADLNPICHLLALLGAHHILHVSRIRVN